MHEIDAHYLHRRLVEYYPDNPTVCARIADDVLGILDIRGGMGGGGGEGMDRREREN